MATHSQEDRPRVYIDAMIPSYLVAPLSQDPKIAEWQRITREFWQDTRFEFVSSNNYSPPRINTPEAILEETNV